MLDEIVATLEAHRDRDRATTMAAYMRDQFPFLGITSPERRRLVAAITKGREKPSAAALTALARALYTREEREFQYVAVDLVCRHVEVGGPEMLDFVHELLITKSWWDTVDALASHATGMLVRVHPHLCLVMDEWVDDENFWIARTAILHQLRYKTDTDVDRLFDYCIRRASDSEFFIRKAIGWALRQYAKVDGVAVREFVKEQVDELSPLSKREALKHLDPL